MYVFFFFFKARNSDHPTEDTPKQEGSIVDMLLADVRSGFANCNFSDSNFSITKIQKVQLDQHETLRKISNESESPPSSTCGDSIQSDDSRSEFVRRGYGRKSMRISKRSSDSSQTDTESIVSTDTDTTISTGVSGRTTSSETDFTDIDIVYSSQEDMRSIRRPRQKSSEDECLMEYLGHQIGETKSVDSFDKYSSLRRRRHDKKDRRSYSDVDLLDRERASSPCTMQEDAMTSSVTRRDKSTPGDSRFKFGVKEVKEFIRNSNSSLETRDIERAKIETSEMNDIERERSKKIMPTAKSSDTGNAGVGRLSSLYSSPTQSRKYNNSFQSDDVRLERTGSLKKRNGHISECSLQTITEKDKKLSLSLTSNSSKICETNKSCASNIIANNVGTINKSNTANVSKSHKGEHGNPLHEKENLHEDKYILDQSRANAVDNTKEQKLESHHVSVSVRSKLSRQWQSNLGRANIDQILKQIEDKKIDIDLIKNRTNTDSPDFTSRKIKEKESTVAGSPTYIDCEEDKSLTTSSLSNSSISMTSNCTSPTDKDNKSKREKRKVRRELCVDDVTIALNTCKDINADAYIGMNKYGDFDQSESNVSGERPPRSRSGSESMVDKENYKTQKDDSSTKQPKLTGKRRFRAERFGDKENISSGRCRSNVEKVTVDRALRNLISHGSMSRSKSYDESVARKYNGEFEMTKGTNNGSGSDTFGGKRSFLRGSTGRLNGDSRRYGCYIPSYDSDSEPPMDNVRCSSKSSSRLSVKSTSTSTETLQAENCSDSESIPEYQRQSLQQPQQQIQRTQDTNRRGAGSVLYSVQDNQKSSVMTDRKMRRAYSNLEPSAVESALARCEENVRNYDDSDPSPISIMAKWRLERDRKRKIDHGETIEQQKLQNKQTDTAKFDHGFFINKQGDFRNESGCRSSLASVSDKDEGFETMSETISQRTSVSSNLDLESDYNVPVISRKSDILKFKYDIEPHRSGIEAENLRKNHGTAIITVQSEYSESDVRKQRTEYWTASTVRTHANTRKKEANVVSILDCVSSSTDSAHDTPKDNMWHDNFKETHKLIINDPKANLANSNNTLTVGSVALITSANATISSSTISPSTPITSPETSSATSPKATPKSSRVPGYMKKTSSSTVKSRIGGKDQTSISYSTNKSTIPNRTSKLNRSVHVVPSNAAPPLTRSNSLSTESITSSISEKHNKTLVRRSVAGISNSPSTQTSSVSAYSSSYSKTSAGNSSLSRTQSLRSPNIRPLNVSSPRLVTSERKSTGSSLARNISRSSSFMSPTASSKAKKDQKSMASPTQSSSTNTTSSRLSSENSKSSSANLQQSEKSTTKPVRSKIMSPITKNVSTASINGSGSYSGSTLPRPSSLRQSTRGIRDTTTTLHQDYNNSSLCSTSENASTSNKLRTPRRTKSLGSTDNREAILEKTSERKFERLYDRKSTERMSTSRSSLVSDRKLNTVDEDDNGGFDVGSNRKNSGSNNNTGNGNVNTVNNWGSKIATKDKSLFKRIFPKSKEKNRAEISGRQTKLDISEKVIKRKNIK